MSPRMVHLERALYYPELIFKSLKRIKPAMNGGRPALSHTYHAAECRVTLDDKEYMLYMPFSPDMVDKIENLEFRMYGIAAKFIIPQTIFRNEINFIGFFGERISCDVILQEIPDGCVTLKEAMRREPLSNIRRTINKLRSEMGRFYFTHGNLNLTNILVGGDNEIYLLRYWYSRFGTDCQDNFSKLESLVQIHYPMLHPIEPMGKHYDTPFQRRLENGYVGLADQDGEFVIPPIYSWLSEFTDGVAVAVIDGKMGAIDTLGRTVVPIEYDDIEFESESGLFNARKADKRYQLDYRGQMIEE